MANDCSHNSKCEALCCCAGTHCNDRNRNTDLTATSKNSNGLPSFEREWHMILPYFEHPEVPSLEGDEEKDHDWKGLDELKNRLVMLFHKLSTTLGYRG